MVTGLDRVTAANLPPFALQTPVFDPTPNDEGFNNTSGDETTVAGVQLLKGFRGPYLHLPPNQSAFRDGWANVNTDPTEDLWNYGWNVTPTADTLNVQTLGSDGQITLASDDPYRLDVGDTILASDWQTIVESWTVSLENVTGGTLDLTNGGVNPAPEFRMRLLVFVAGIWRQFTSNRQQVSSFQPGETGRVVFTFQADSSLTPNPVPGAAPLGRHLLVLMEDPNGTLHDNDDAVYLYNSAPLTAQVMFFPRTERPTIVLSLK